MISAVRADDLIPVCVAAFETAIHDTDRLTAQNRVAAVAGLTGERGCHDGLELKAQPRVTAITQARCGDGGRTGISHDVIRVASTAHSAHRQELVPGRYRGLEQRRRLSSDGSTQAVRGACPAEATTAAEMTTALSFQVEPYFRAWNAHDPDGVAAALADGGTYTDPTVTGSPLRPARS